MFKPVTCLFLSVFSSLYSYSQIDIEPTTEDVIFAKSLKEQYPEASVVLEQSEDFFAFGVNRNTHKVEVIQEIQESLINIDPRSDIQKYSFYDSQSSVDRFDIKDLKGRRIDTPVKEEAYKSNELFYNDARVKYANINFPVIGSRATSYIKKEYKDIKYLTKVFFNDDHPILKKVIRFEVPSWLELELREMNFDNLSITKEVIQGEKNKTTTYIYTLENVPAFYRESGTPGPTHIYPHILVLAKSFQDEDNQKQVLFESTKDLYAWYKILVEDLKNDNTSLKEKVAELTQAAVTDEEKIKNIYYWVQDNIRYIAFEDGIAGFKPDEASNVFEKRYGDCKGMANLIKQMLIEAGYDARLTWIGTNRIAYDYSIPSLGVDNHMICTLFKDGEMIFLDGTEKFNPLGEYAFRIQGKQALIENDEDFILKEVPAINSTFNKEIQNYTFTIVGDKLIGDATKVFNGESRTSLLNFFDSFKKDNKDEFLGYYLMNGDNNIVVDDIVTNDLSDRETTLNIAYKINVKNAVSSFDNSVYIDLDINKELKDFLLEERKTDYLFDYKKNLESTTILEIPSEYLVEHIPQDLSVSSQNFDVQVSFEKLENSIVYKKSFNIKNAKIETSDFEQWNEFISNLRAIYNEQIVLTHK